MNRDTIPVGSETISLEEAAMYSKLKAIWLMETLCIVIFILSPILPILCLLPLCLLQPAI